MRVERPREHPHAQRLSKPSALRIAEFALLLLIGVQVARIAWAATGPLGVHTGTAPGTVRTDRNVETFAASASFFRLPPTAAASAPMRYILFGVRAGERPEEGSAIIGTGGADQRSYAVGEEIEPGVTLAAVAFDHVRINSNGTDERIDFPGSTDKPQQGQIDTRIGTQEGSPAARLAELQYQPHMEGDRVQGIVVQPVDSGGALSALGLAVGDVILSVNGRGIRSPQQAMAVGPELRRGGATIVVRRDGRLITLRL